MLVEYNTKKLSIKKKIDKSEQQIKMLIDKTNRTGNKIYNLFFMILGRQKQKN